MPTAQLKPEKPPELAVESADLKPRLPTEHFYSIPPKLIKDLEMGDDVSLVLRGKVTGLSINKSEYRDEGREERASLDIEISGMGITKTDKDIDELVDD